MTLFDTAGLSRHSDPETSRQAALAVSAGVEEAVYRMHRSGDLRGLTDNDLAFRLPHLFGPTVKSARSRLTKRGLLVDSGLRRPSLRGRDSIVWVPA